MSASAPTPGPHKATLNFDGRHHAVPILAISAEFENEETQPYHPLIAQVLTGRGHAPKEIAEATALLYAEAGTVAHETGMTPRQLTDEIKVWKDRWEYSQEVISKADLARNVFTSQRNELLKACTLTLKRLGELNRDDEAGIRIVLSNAIAKAQQEG